VEQVRILQLTHAERSRLFQWRLGRVGPSGNFPEFASGHEILISSQSEIAKQSSASLNLFRDLSMLGKKGPVR